MRKRLAFVPRGAFCEHRRMRYRTCEGCRTAGGKPCWMLGEGDYGYYFAGKRP